jgi:hypothetical protein
MTTTVDKTQITNLATQIAQLIQLHPEPEALAALATVTGVLIKAQPLQNRNNLITGFTKSVRSVCNLKDDG